MSVDDSAQQLDPIYGVMISEKLDFGKITFAFALGNRAVATVLDIDRIAKHEVDDHLMTFSGVSIQEPDIDGAWVGQRVSGIKNQALLKFVFLTEVDGVPVAQNESYRRKPKAI